MGGLPLHPALVHVPIGLALVLPLITAAVAWGVLGGRCPTRSWLLVVGLQAILLASALASLQTGEDEEERVEDRVAHDVIETHEERATAFTWASGITLAVAAAGFLAKRPGMRKALVFATLAGTLATAGLGAATGHAGGTIVHGPGGLAAQGGVAAAADDGDD